MPQTKRDDETAKDSISPDFLQELGISPEEQAEMEKNAYSGAADDIAKNNGLPDEEEPDLATAEAGGIEAPKKSKGEKEESEKLGKGYNKEDAKNKGGVRNNLGNKWSGMSSRKKASIGAATAVGASAIIASMFGLLSLLGVFRLDHFLYNIEAKAFIRYQVDMDGRSSKWINTYISLRLGEIDDPSKPVADRDNIFFKSDRVDTNNPLIDWYKTLRLSSFEDDVFTKQGVVFRTHAFVDTKSHVTKFRTARLEIKDEDIPLESFTNTELNRMADGDFTFLDQDRLDKYFKVTEFATDKAARKDIKQFVKDNTKFYQFAKRYYIRKAIMNVTGTRNWKFFEKTRNDWTEKKISVRNKIIAKALPDSTRLGKIVQCVTGVSKCQGRDPVSPENQSDAARGIATTSVEADTPDKLQATILKSLNIGAKLSGPVALVETVSTLYHIDNALQDGSLSDAVTTAKQAQAIGMYTQFGIARDQLHTGETNEPESGEFMSLLSKVGTSEGWNTVVTGNPVKGGATKDEQCKPENRAKVDGSQKTVKSANILYNCPQDMVGGAGRAKFIENSWNNSFGTLLKPIFVAYKPFSKVVDMANDAIAAVVGPVIQGVIKVIGLDDNMEQFLGWALGKVMAFLGGGPIQSADAPSGIWTNNIIQGAAATAETTMRTGGAAITTNESRVEAEQRVAAYQQKEQANQTIFGKYLSLGNHDSFAASSLFAATGETTPTLDPGSIARSLASSMGTLFGMNHKTMAADDNYAAAKFAGIDTYDFPPQCLNSSPLATLGVNYSPAETTNADELGIVPASDLTWELVSDSIAFYSRLYETGASSDKINQVYNCAIFDSTVRGSLAGRYAPDLAGPNAYKEESPSSSGVGPGGSIVVASFNILHSDDSYASWTNRLRKTTKAIKDNNVSVVGLQEARKDQQSVILKDDYLGSSYKKYPVESNGPRFTPNAVVYNSDDYELVEGKLLPIEYDKGDKKVNDLVQVRLRKKSNGGEFYFLSTHDPANIRCHNAGVVSEAVCNQSRIDNAHYYVEHAKELSKDGIPVFLVGDFNSVYGTGKNDPSCIVSSSGVIKDTWEIFKKISGCASSRPIGRAIDRVYVSKDLEVADFWSVEGGRNGNGPSGSDHDAIMTEVVFPGSKEDESSTTNKVAWPVAGKYWESSKSDFLDAHTMISGTFTSPYVKGLAVDISSPPLGSSVYSMLDGTVERISLCGQGDGMMIKSTVAGGTLHIAYGHGTNPRFKVGDKVKAGDQILNLGATGCKVYGAHLHIDMALDTKHICPQDVFLAMGKGEQPDFKALTAKAKAPCGR